MTVEIDEHFAAGESRSHQRALRLTAAEARTLIGMTPSARHVPVAGLPTTDVTVTAAVRVTAYHPR